MGEANTMDGHRVVHEMQGLIGELTDDEAALVRTLTPGRLTAPETIEHLFDLVDLITTVRYDEALADYVYAIAPEWDDSVGLLLLGGRVTTALARYELERHVPARSAEQPARPDDAGAAGPGSAV